jgi:arylsulfatase A-like enzyme
MSRPRAEPRAATVLFAGSGAVAVLVAVANVIALCHAMPVARPRDLRLIARARIGLDAHAPALLARLPAVLHTPFDLGAPASIVTFLALAVALHVLMVWIVAAVAAPLVVPPIRRRAGGGEAWPRGYPLAVVAAALIPVIAHRVSLWTDAGAATIVAASLALAIAGWRVAMWLCRPRAVVTRLVTVCLAVTLAGGTFAVAGGTIALARATHHVDARALPPAGAPNVLLVSIDTLRPDHLGSYGYPRATSPTLDGLATEGARFTTVLSPTSWTLPAHVTLLTALPPEVHGVVEDGLRLDEGVVTLAEVLRARGYATAGFVSGPYLDAGYGFARGFDHYDDYSAVRFSRPAVHQAHSSPRLLAIVSAWLDAWDATSPRRPFFAFVHMWDVHYDFNPPPPYDTMFDPGYTGHVTGDDFEFGTAVHAGMDARDLAHVIALYDGEIAHTDAWVGRILDTLRRRHVLDETIVVVTSDHGEEFFEHGKKGHRNALYDESVRVPLFVRFPARIPAGTVVDRQVRLLDVAPTILALSDTPLPPPFGLAQTRAPDAGTSLVPWLSPTPPAAPPVPAFASLEPQAQAAIRHDNQKLILNPLATPQQQLFDLTTDPKEQTDKAGSDPTSVHSLHTALTTWQDTARLAAKQTQEAHMDEEHKAALRALGYLK